MEALLVSTGIVSLAEIGDKTQLLSVLLAARFRKPWPIICGIFLATLANHACAGALGGWITQMLGENALRWGLGLGLIGMAAWMLVPDRLDEGEIPSGTQRGLGILGTTIVAFFFAEMGDKTQIATVALAARFNDAIPVIVGTTLGMLLANIPAVLLGDRFSIRLPITLVRRAAALAFLILGGMALAGVGA